VARTKRRFLQRRGLKRRKQRLTVTRIRNTNRMPLPERMMSTFVTDFVGVYSATSGGGANPTFVTVSANSIFAPFSTSDTLIGAGGSGIGGSTTTVKPSGYDILVQGNAYQNFTVYASSIRVNVTPQVTGDAVHVCLFPLSPGSGVPGSLVTAMKQPFCKYRFCSTTNPLGNYLSAYISIGPLCGLPKTVVTSSAALSGGVASRPVEECFWCIVTYTADGSSIASPIGVSYTVKHYAALWNCNYQGMASV